MTPTEERGLALCAEALKNAARCQIRQADFDAVAREVGDERLARLVLIAGGYSPRSSGRWVSRAGGSLRPPFIDFDYSILATLLEDEDPSDQWEERPHLTLVA